MELKFGSIRVFIEENALDLGKRAMEVFAKVLGRGPVNIGLATGSSPVPLYDELINAYKAGKLDFSNMTTFNLDEYYPIKKSDNQSYDYFMKDKLFNHINVNMDKLNIPNGEAADPAEECKRYDDLINSIGGVDLQVLGIGLNGHIAFNEPAKTFSRGTNLIDLTPSTIEANSRFFSSYDEVPKRALTMGIKNIMQAKEILLIASGEAKADIIAQTIFGEITPEVPSSVLQLHQNVTFVLDKACGKKLV